jgi:hypothetical protein
VPPLPHNDDDDDDEMIKKRTMKKERLKTVHYLLYKNDETHLED